MSGRARGFNTVAGALRSVERAAARKKKAREQLAAEIAARVPGEGYEPCIVSFIDVLGFRDLLATRHAHDIREVLLQLREFTAPTDEVTTRRMKDARLLSRAFADSASGRVRAKFEWLAAYHNSVVEEILSEYADGRRSADAFMAEYERDPVPFLEVMIVSACPREC